MKKITLLLPAIFWAISFINAQEEQPNQWTPKDIIETEYLRGAVFTPNNKMVVWTKKRAVKKKDKFVSDLYLTRLDIEQEGKFKTIRLTNADENDYGAFFSKDGETIYFRSSRDKGKKLWSLSVFGGEPEEVHEFKNGISNVQWQNDSTFLFVSNDGKTLYEQELKEKKDNVVVVEDEENWTIAKVYAFDVKEKEIKRVTNNDFPVSTYAVAKNGEWIVFSTVQSRHYASDANPKPKHYLQNISTGAITEILQETQEPRSFQFTADHEGFYFATTRSNDKKWGGAGIGQLNYFNVNTQSTQAINLDWDWGMNGGYRVIGNDVVVNLANGLTRKLAFYAKAENWRKLDLDVGAKKDHISILAIADDGKKILYDYSTTAKLPKYYVANVDMGKSLRISDEKELTTFNQKLKEKNITKSEQIKWKGWKGEEVTGILYYPENYEVGKQYPLMVSIHGGPASQTLDRWAERWSTYPNILAQKGAFTLKPNYHGSSNHGLAFVESIAQNYYEPEMEDIIKGITFLQEKGLIDTTKIGTMGWSNGAIITTMLTVRYPDMFKVACAGAGDVNWTSDYGTCRFGVSFDQHYFGGAPWDDVDGKTYNENYILKSPLFELEKVKTPTIIFHGSEDRAVPRDQGWEYYRALQQADKTAVRFLWFPDQPHGLQKITHQMRKMEEELAWIDKYLFQKEVVKNASLKEESPLAVLLKKEKLAKHQGSYGLWQNNMLIPETAEIAKDSTAIGIFEVTNAQFRLFDVKHKISPDEINHPVLVPHHRAIAYTKWLSAKTGKTYRLPNAEEAEHLDKKAKKIAAAENTLKHWAGYDLSPKDANALKKEIVGRERQLVKPVGVFEATTIGEAKIYDLGGNATEYYGETGKTYGFSAVDFVDKMGENEERSPVLQGFRVIKE